MSSANPTGAETAQPNDLYTIAYTSHLTNKDEVGDIIKVACRKNPAKQISGMLWYEDDTQRVIQILEGPRAHLEALLEVLKLDTRHRDMNILYQHAVSEKRHFPEFGMLYGAEEFLGQVPELVDALGYQNKFNTKSKVKSKSSDSPKFKLFSSVTSRVPGMGGKRR